MPALQELLTFLVLNRRTTDAQKRRERPLLEVVLGLLCADWQVASALHITTHASMTIGARSRPLLRHSCLQQGLGHVRF